MDKGMKVGRNDPCPCGSGKKYKKCCLRKEIERKNEELRRKRAEEEFWEEFYQASREEKVHIFQEQLRTGKPEIPEVLKMFAGAEWEVRKDGDYGTVAGLVELIKERQPDAYKKDWAFYHTSLIENMGVAGDFDSLPQALEPFSWGFEYAHAFRKVIEILMYHNRTEDLVDVMERTYPDVSAPSESSQAWREEFGYFLGWLEVFKRMGELDMEGLYSAVSMFWDLSREEFKEVVAPVVAGSSRRWYKEDFTGPWSSIRSNLLSLTAEVMDELHGKGTDYPRTLLAMETLIEYISEEYYHPVGIQKAYHPVGIQKAGSLLVPEEEGLSEYLLRLLDPINYLPYRVASTVEVLPSYLKFLHARRLIEGDVFEEALVDLRPLKDNMVRFLKMIPEGKVVVPSIERGWEIR